MQPLLVEVGTRQLDGGRREVDAGHVGAALGEAGEIDAGAAADLENRPAAVAVKVHEPEQMVELLEMILIEVVEKAARADGMSRDFEVVDVPVPVARAPRRWSLTAELYYPAPADASRSLIASVRRGGSLDDNDLTSMIRRRSTDGRTFDVLVVGGGIYGLTIAYDAAQRGLSVALVERDDFGSGASFNHLRTIHGGLRYLQTLDLGRARESIRERGRWRASRRMPSGRCRSPCRCIDR